MRLETKDGPIVHEDGRVSMPYEHFLSLAVRSATPAEKFREICWYVDLARENASNASAVEAALDTAKGFLSSLEQDVLESHPSCNTCCSDAKQQ